MAYVQFIPYDSNQSGRYRSDFLVNNTLTLGSILGTAALYYPGSTIVIRESIQIECEILEPELVDRDLNWYYPRDYLGSVQVTSQTSVGEFVQNSDNEFFLTSTYQQFTRDNLYTVIADVTTPIAELGGGYIDECNFALQPGIIDDGVVPVIPISGALVMHKYPSKGPVFKTRNSLIATPLKETLYAPLFKGVGIFTKPGIRCVSVRHEISGVNRAPVELPALPNVSCRTRNVPCEEQYAAYIVANPGLVFETFGACEAYRLNPPPGLPPNDTAGTCVLDAWICPSDETFIVPSYTIQYGN
jgi:hypothetical protein